MNAASDSTFVEMAFSFQRAAFIGYEPRFTAKSLLCPGIHCKKYLRRNGFCCFRKQNPLWGFKEYCFEHSPIPQEKRNALYGLLVSHFKTEERLATSASIDFSGHEDAHEKMLETVSQTLGQMASNNSDLYSLIRYISYWFEIHILRHDLTLAKCLSAAAH